MKKSKRIKVIDLDIVEVAWLDIEKINKNKIKVQSPETFREIHDYLQGQKFPLAVIDSYVW